MIEGFVRLMNSGDDLTGPVNLGNPGEFTMLELAETVLKLVSSKSKLVHKTLPEDDPRQRQPNIALAKSNLGWTPGFNWKTVSRKPSSISAVFSNSLRFSQSHLGFLK